MNNQIQEFLKNIEANRQIQILYAFESGSRAWGFPSPDSDYDIRFLYVYPKEKYFELNSRPDQITLPMQGLLDGSGWELPKFLRLMQQSNATPFEWLQSDIVYIQNEALHDALWALSAPYAQPRKLIHHYLGIAKGMLAREFQEDTVKIKKYFYVLRPVLAALWLVEKGSVPPLNFHQLLPLVESNPPVLERIHALLKEKEQAKEGHRVPKVPLLDSYLSEKMEYCGAATAHLKKHEIDWTPINDFWKEFLQKHV